MTFIRRRSVPLMACALAFCALRGLAFAEEIKIPQPQEATLSADEIIARMVNVYETCQSYQADGLVEWTVSNQTYLTPFSISFVRPNLFRFEYENDHRPHLGGRKFQYVLWWDGQRIQGWSTTTPQVQEFDSLGASPETSSFGSADRIVRLLMRKNPRVSAAMYYPNTKLLGEEPVNGVPCYHIEYWQSGTHTIWVDKERFLILKVMRRQTGDHKSTTVTTYNPLIDMEIDPATFTFVPPAFEAAVVSQQPSPWYVRLARKLFGP